MPSLTSFSSSARISPITSSPCSGCVPAYIWNAPLSAYAETPEYTEYAKPAALADLLEQTARQAAAEDLVDDVERLAIIVATRQRAAAHHDVHLLGVVVDRIVASDLVGCRAHRDRRRSGEPRRRPTRSASAPRRVRSGRPA